MRGPLELGGVSGDGRRREVNVARGRALISSRESESGSGLEDLGEVERGGEELDAVVGGEREMFSLSEEGGSIRRLFEGGEGGVIVDVEVVSICKS